MIEPLQILLATIFVNNIVVVQFLGLCPFMGASRQLAGAWGMASATLFVLTIATATSYLLDTYLLEPLALTYLRIIAFILVIAITVQFAAFVIRATQPLLHQVLGVFIPLITTNCAVLGVALLNARSADSFASALLTGRGAGLGFGIVLIAFAAIREQLREELIPLPFRGAAIHMITAGILSLAFMGFAGLA